MTFELYAVVEHNQASRQPVEDRVTFCDNKTEAFDMAHNLTVDNRASGRRESYRVYLLEPVEEDER